MVPKAYTKAKHRKLVSQVLKIRNRRQNQELGNLHTCTADSSCNDDWNGDEWNDLINGTMTGVLLDGTKVGSGSGG